MTILALLAPGLLEVNVDSRYPIADMNELSKRVWVVIRKPLEFRFRRSLTVDQGPL